MQSLGGIAHYDFNEAGAHSYEQIAGIMRKLSLSQIEIEQLFRRMVFNEVAKNYDDHVKNVSFLMDRRGKWKLAPAYDMTFSYNPTSLWTSNHQIMINGKRNDITVEDMFMCGKNMDISEKKIKQIVNQIIQVVSQWPQYAQKAELEEVYMEEIRKHHQYN